MSYDIGVRLGVDGEQAFRSSINAINANIKSMGSELKAVTAQFSRNADSEEALTAKNAVLAKSIAATKDKIGVLDKQLERQAEKLRDLGKALDEVVKAHGADSKEALEAQNAYNNQAKAVAKLQDQLNGAKAELAGMENAVKDNRDAIDGLGREVEDAGDAMEEAGQSAVSFGDLLKANIISDFVVEGLRKISDGLKEFVKDSIGNFGDYEQLVGGVETLFKNSAEQVQEYAQNAFKITSMGTWLKNQLSGFISNTISAITGGGSSSTASSGGGTARRSAATPAALAAAEWEPDPDPAPAPFRAARLSGGEALAQAVTRSLSNAESQTRATAAIRRVQRDMADTGASVAAYYTTPERRSGGNPPAGNTENGMDYRTMVSAFQEAMEKMNINLDGRKVGRMTTIQQSNMGKAFGTA